MFPAHTPVIQLTLSFPREQSGGGIGLDWTGGPQKQNTSSYLAVLGTEEQRRREKVAKGYGGFLKTEMHLNSDLFSGLSQREGANCREEGTDTWLYPPSSLQSFASSKVEKDRDGRGREESRGKGRKKES